MVGVGTVHGGENVHGLRKGAHAFMLSVLDCFKFLLLEAPLL